MRWVKRALVGLSVIVIVLAAVGVWVVRRSFPDVDGELAVPGLEDRVEVVRDEWGVPHIYAGNTHDLFFAQGYTHAQERFWQMDFWRHIGAGRLSEMFGEGQLDTDRFLRSLDLVGLANQELQMMDEGNLAVLESYAEGVNAYLEDRSGSEVSLEYALLPLQAAGYEIEPWTPVNTLTWAKMMSWDLSGNMGEEIARALLARQLSTDRVSELYPPYPEDHPVIVPDDQTRGESADRASLPTGALTALQSAGDAAHRVWDLTGGGFEDIGSNSWVVGGSLTKSGLPLLANDTHLAIQMPSIWFENALHCVGDPSGCPYQVIGFTFAGTPGVVIGHNEHIAWGVTNEAADTQDLFVERVNPANRGQYEVDGNWVDFETRVEEFAVAGGADIEYEVRSTRHGPVISGTYLDDGELDGTGAMELPDEYVVALRWQTLEPSTLVEAIIGLDTASGYQDFLDSARRWDIAAQNLVYADVKGNIAYQSTGEIPVRASGNGLYPVLGWSNDHEWVSTVPFEDMPYLLNPPRDYIESANQPVIRSGREPFIGIEGSYGYRANRIEELILSKDDHDVTSMQEIQFDDRDGGAANLVPHLLDVDDRGDKTVADTKTRLRSWMTEEGLRADGDSGGAALYQAVWRHVLANIFRDELPEDYWPVGGSRWFDVVRLTLEDETASWWDDVTTPAVESRDEILYRSLVDARDELVGRLGDDPSDWSWGDLHTARFENQTFGQSGIGPIEMLFNRTAPHRVGGSTSLVNSVGWDADKSFAVDWLPSERMVVDLSDFASSTFAHTTGQSGHAFHHFYDDMIEPWTDGEQGPMLWGRRDVDANSTSTLILVPEG